jgi:hypothetical protein
MPGELGGGGGAEVGEDRQRLAQRRLLARVVQGERGLVRAAQAEPQPGGFLPVALGLVQVGPGELAMRLAVRTGPPQPGGELASLPRVEAGRYVVGQLGFESGQVRLALQPVRLGAGQAGRNDPLWLAGRVGGRRDLVKVFPGTRLAAPGPDQAEHLQRAVPVGRRRVGADQQFGAELVASSQRPVRFRAFTRSPRR